MQDLSQQRLSNIKELEIKVDTNEKLYQSRIDKLINENLIYENNIEVFSILIKL